MMDDLITSLKSLEVKYLDVVRKFIGMCVGFENGGFTLDQEKLIHDYLDAQTMTKVNPEATPTVLHRDM